MTQVLDFCLWIFPSLQVPQNFRRWGNLRKGEAPQPQQRLNRKVLREEEGKRLKGWVKGCPGIGKRMLRTVQGNVQGWERRMPQNGIRRCLGCGELGKGMPGLGKGMSRLLPPAAGSGRTQPGREAAEKEHRGRRGGCRSRRAGGTRPVRGVGLSGGQGQGQRRRDPPLPGPGPRPPGPAPRAELPQLSCPPPPPRCSRAARGGGTGTAGTVGLERWGGQGPGGSGRGLPVHK